jgi:hypothetical protein
MKLLTHIVLQRFFHQVIEKWVIIHDSKNVDEELLKNENKRKNWNVWWEMISFTCLCQIEEFFIYVKMRVSHRFRVNNRLTFEKLAIYVKVRILLRFCICKIESRLKMTKADFRHSVASVVSVLVSTEWNEKTSVSR